MDILLNNEINTRTKEINKGINDFINELQNSLENPKSKISIDRNFYDEIYNELELAPKYKNRLEDIIKDSMLEYSHDTEFLYVNYDEKDIKILYRVTPIYKGKKSNSNRNINRSSRFKYRV